IRLLPARCRQARRGLRPNPGISSSRDGASRLTLDTPYALPDCSTSRMRIVMRLLAFPAVAAALLVVPGLASTALAEGPAKVFRGARLLTVSHGEIDPGDLVVRDGKIVSVGMTGEVEVPEGAQVIDLAGKVIVPGLVDTHSHIGIGSRPAVEANNDVN